MIIKILGVGICTLIINLIVNQYKPEIAMLVNVCGGLIIFSLVINSAENIINQFINLQNESSFPIDVVSPIMKVIGVGYVTEFTADLAEDAGNKSISSKVLLGGKIAICSLAIPIVKSLLSAIFSII